MLQGFEQLTTFRGWHRIIKDMSSDKFNKSLFLFAEGLMGVGDISGEIFYTLSSNI